MRTGAKRDVSSSNFSRKAFRISLEISEGNDMK